MNDRELSELDHCSSGKESAQIPAAEVEHELAMIDELAREVGQSWSLEETSLEVLERLREESANRGAASSHQRSP